MSHSTPAGYGPAVAALLQPPRLMPLGPGTPNQPALSQLQALAPDRLFTPRGVRDREMAAACLAGLWLVHDFLDESHSMSQEIHTASGSYWHGLMHRREPDFGNAKYWFHRVGAHPVFPALADAARELAAKETQPEAAFLKGQSAWDPFAFIDLCEAASSGRLGCELLCRRIQQREWELLFDYCYRHAVGES